MLQAEISWVIRIGAEAIECAVSARGRKKVLPVLKEIRIPVRKDADELPETGLRHAFVQAVASIKQQHESVPAWRKILPDVQVLVSDAWLALTVLHWSSGFTGLADMEQAARQQFVTEGLADLADAVIRVDEAPGFARMRMAVAYPVYLIEMLRTEIAAAGLRLVSILPQAVAVVDYVRGLPQAGSRKSGRKVIAGAVAVLEGETVRFMYLQRTGIVPGAFCRDGRLLEAPEKTVQALWRRQQLRYPALAMDEALQVCVIGRMPGGTGGLPGPASKDNVLSRSGGSGTGSALIWVDFPALEGSSAVLIGQAARRFSSLDVLMVPAQRNAAWRVAAVLLVCVAGVMAFQAVRMARQARMQEQALAVQSQAQPVKSKVAWTREEVARIRVVNDAIRQLNLPIGPVLRSLLPPRDIRVALLGIDIEPDRQGGGKENQGGLSLKLSAEALSGGEMARYVSYLGDQEAMAGAYLVRHEIDETRSGQPYRFTVEIVWRE